ILVVFRDLFTSSYYSHFSHHFLHSFPTRRSSDLPIPINTIFDILIFSSCSTAINCSTISPLLKFLIKLIPVDAQNLHPILHPIRSEEHTSELQSRFDIVCRLLLEKKNQRT